MNIGILTYYQSNNYGSFLQGYALVTALRTLGYNAELINFNMVKAAKRYAVRPMRNPLRYFCIRKRHKMFDEIIESVPVSKEKIISDNTEDLRKAVYGKYDLIIAGSDEIWRTDNFRGFPTPYWLDGDFGCMKCTYAISSLSDDSVLSYEDSKLIEKFVSDFSYLSARDVCTKKKLEALTSKSVDLVCDPVFMYDFCIDKEKGRRILKEKFGIKTDKKLVGFMNTERSLAMELKRRLGKNIEFIALYDYMQGFVNVMTVTPFEWVHIISCLDFMVTSYFHGTCFSILGNTPFYAFDCTSADIEHSKIGDFLNRAGLSDNFSMKSDSDYIDKIVTHCNESLESNTEVDFSEIRNTFGKSSKPFLKFLESI